MYFQVCLSHRFEIEFQYPTCDEWRISTYDRPIKQAIQDEGGNKSKAEFQEMQQLETENRSSIKLPQVQLYDPSHVQSMNSNQIVANAMGSVEPKASPR